MQLCGLWDGDPFALDGRTLGRLPVDEGGEPVDLAGCRARVLPRGGTQPVGRLPRARGTLRDRLLAGWPGRVTAAAVGEVSTATVHRLGESVWLATVGTELFVSPDGAETWRRRCRLPADSGPSGVLPSAVATRGSRVYVGEYPLDGTRPRVLRSADRGHTWQTGLSLPEVRHVHAIQRDPYGTGLWVTTGDADAECLIGRLRAVEGESDGAGVERLRLERVGGGSQEWRAVELAFTPEAVLWGVDCGYAAVNRLYRLDRTRLGEQRPVPEPVGAVDASVYHAATLRVDGDHWVVLSTAVETGTDRTAPGRETTGGSAARVVAASSRTDYTRWHELAAFRRRRRPVDRLPAVPAANAYVYLAAGPEAGLVLNPVNTRRADGRLLRVAPSEFGDLAGARATARG